MTKKIITTKGHFDLSALSIPYIPETDVNKYYEVQWFENPHRWMTDISKHNTLGCIFFATKDQLNYIDEETSHIISLPFKELDKHYLSSNGKMRSIWLESFMPTSLNIPDRIYHLAAVIKNEHPSTNWDFLQPNSLL